MIVKREKTSVFAFDVFNLLQLVGLIRWYTETSLLLLRRSAYVLYYSKSKDQKRSIPPGLSSFRLCFCPDSIFPLLRVAYTGVMHGMILYHEFVRRLPRHRAFCRGQMLRRTNAVESVPSTCRDLPARIIYPRFSPPPSFSQAGTIKTFNLSLHRPRIICSSLSCR